MATRDQDYRIYQEEKEPIKGRAGKVYSINREKLKEAIEIFDATSKRLKDMLKETETKENIEDEED